jgi:hypothetical protein
MEYSGDRRHTMKKRGIKLSVPLLGFGFSGFLIDFWRVGNQPTVHAPFALSPGNSQTDQ